MSFLIVLVFRGIISCIRPDSSSTVQQVMIINELSYPINSDDIHDKPTLNIFNPMKPIMYSNELEMNTTPNIYNPILYDENLSILQHNNVNGPRVRRKKVQEQELIEKRDTIKKVKESDTEKSLQVFNPDMVIQVGAFHNETNALLLREKLSDLLNKAVIIVPADGYFKVRIIGFKSLEEIGDLIQTLGLLGIKNIWVFRAIKKEGDKSQVVVQADTSLRAVKDKINLPVIAEEKPVIAEEKPVMAEPTVNLQVGVFHRRSKALRAQRRITSKLNLPVEIVREWEYYIVFVTGFKTREEIFKYYPKLAALGYPDSFMIENNKGTKQNK